MVKRMPDQSFIIYKISCEGTLDAIDSAKLLEAFTSIDALAIYIYSIKRLYVWKGKHIDLIVGKYVPEAKDLILKADRNIRILRHIVVESGTEPQDFFDDLDLLPNALKAQLEKTEKLYDGLTADMEKLKVLQHELFVKSSYDEAIAKAQELLKLGSKLNKLPVIKEQQAFIKLVEEAKGLNEKLNKDFEDISKLIKNSAFTEAWVMLDALSTVASAKKLPDVQARITRLRDSIAPQYEDHQKNIDLFNRLVSGIEDNIKHKQWDVAVRNCEKILTIAPKIGKQDLLPKYNALLAEVRGKAEMVLAEKKKEQELLIQQANALRDVIPTEKNVLPLVEEFSVQELLGTLSQDIDEMMARAGSLLEKHRVEVKTETESKATLRSASGETVVLEHTSKIETAKSPVSGDDKRSPVPTNNVQTGFENPLDDYIEEAVIKDLIPYNFEITELYVNGDKPAKEPAKNPTREGLEVTWTLQNIPPKEKVDVKYDLRRRVSRTLILTFEDSLKIVKTHAGLAQAETEGIYDALLNFTNSFPNPLRFAVFEDILPLYYLFEIKQPDAKPALTSESNAGTLVKWNQGAIPEKAGLVHQYRLLELFRFETVKIRIFGKLDPALKAYQVGDYSEALATWSPALANLKETLNTPATSQSSVENLTKLDEVKIQIDSYSGKIKTASSTKELIDSCETLLILFKKSAQILETREREKEEGEKRQKAEEIETKRRAAEEEARKKATEDEEAKRRAAEEEARKKAAEDEEAKRRAAEEEARKKVTEDEAISKKLQYAEERFQNAFGDRKYSDCLQSIPEISELASLLNKSEIVEKYKGLQQQIESNIQQEAKRSAEQKEKTEKINQLKKVAADLESAMKFTDAKSKYTEIKKLATEINDPLTVSFCDQRITQIESWAKELSGSDLMKWDITPFKIINRLRYNFVEVITEKTAAQKRAGEIASQSGKGADVKSVTMVRSKFKGQGPYNAKGECYALYLRTAAE